MLRPCLGLELLPLKSWAGRVALRNSKIDPYSVGFCLGQSYCPVFLDITGVSHWFSRNLDYKKSLFPILVCRKVGVKQKHTYKTNKQTNHEWSVGAQSPGERGLRRRRTNLSLFWRNPGCFFKWESTLCRTSCDGGAGVCFHSNLTIFLSVFRFFTKRFDHSRP